MSTNSAIGPLLPNMEGTQEIVYFINILIPHVYGMWSQLPFWERLIVAVVVSSIILLATLPLIVSGLVLISIAWQGLRV